MRHRHAGDWPGAAGIPSLRVGSQPEGGCQGGVGGEPAETEHPIRRCRRPGPGIRSEVRRGDQLRQFPAASSDRRGSFLGSPEHSGSTEGWRTAHRQHSGLRPVARRETDVRGSESEPCIGPRSSEFPDLGLVRRVGCILHPTPDDERGIGWMERQGVQDPLSGDVPRSVDSRPPVHWVQQDRLASAWELLPAHRVGACLMAD